MIKYKRQIIGIKSLPNAVGITAAQVCVNTAQLELVLLVNLNGKYTKCLLLLVRRLEDAKKLLEAVEKRFVNTAHEVSTASTQVNALCSTNIDNLSDAVICSFFASKPNSPQLVYEDLEQIHLDDIEEIDLRWQMAMLTMRAKRKAQKTVETSTSTALVSCDGLGGYDWSDQAKEGPNYALMAFSSSSSNSEVSNDSTCLKSCLETVKLLKSQNDQLLKDLNKSELMVLGYKTDEFVNKPVVENCKAKSSEEEPKPKIEKKIVRPSIAKIEFVKSKQQEKTTRKTVKQVEQHRQNTHSLRGDNTAQTRFESVSKHSNNSLLARGNTLQSDKDRLKIDELMALCTNLQTRVLELEKTKTTQHNEIASLKRRVKTLEMKNRSRTHKLKRLYKVGLTARVESFDNKESLGEDASKQERKIDAIDADEYITLVNVKDDKEMFDVDDLGGEEVFVAGKMTMEDLEDLYNLVKARYGSTRPVESMDYLLWSEKRYPLTPPTLLMMLEKKLLTDYEKKKYPLTPPTLLMMLEKKLQIDYESEMAYQLCKLIKKQLKK
nr:ribonuclease H-like domain-containing protein [Tanacetum cinerariifolium]